MNQARPDTSPNDPESGDSLIPSPESAFRNRPRKLAMPGGMTVPAAAGFLIVNSFTGFNLLIGVLALIVASTGQSVLAAWGVLVCVLLDSCDGSLARRWKVTSEFGAQLDSLADMTSFIIASVGLAYYWARPTTPFLLLIAVCGLYALSGAIRLARFNTTAKQSGYFEGMPTTGGAAVLAALYLVAPPPSAHGIVALVALLAFLMVSLLPYPKLTTLRHCPAWFWIGIAAGALMSIHAVVWVLTTCYVCLGPAVWVYRRTKNQEPRTA